MDGVSVSVASLQLPDSPLIGQSVFEARLGEKYDLEVLGHVRDRVMRSVVGFSGTLREGDIPLVKEGRSLKRADFRNRFQATTLAIRRHGEDIREKIGHVRLQVGDQLLVLAPERVLERLRTESSFIILQEVSQTCWWDMKESRMRPYFLL